MAISPVSMIVIYGLMFKFFFFANAQFDQDRYGKIDFNTNNLNGISTLQITSKLYYYCIRVGAKCEIGYRNIFWSQNFDRLTQYDWLR